MQRSDIGGGEGPDLALTLWTYRKRILVFTFLGALGGVIASYVVKPLYKSEVVMYPAVTNSVSRALLLEQNTGRDDILALGDETNAEQLLQMLRSDRVRDRVAEKFDLEHVYGIDPASKTRRTELIDAYEEHITSERTELGSIRIEVLDQDPQRAADIANHIAELVDVVWAEMARERASKGVTAVERKLAELQEQVQVTDDSLRMLRKLGVHDYYSQSERYNEYIGAAIVKGDHRAVQELEERFRMLAEHAGPYVRLQDQLNYDMRRIAILQMKLEQATADMESEVPHKFMVNYAQPSDSRHWPKRWLFLAISAASALLIALCSIVLEKNLTKIREHHG
jgi:uncharacterized protein involved in exopolysaccharide biosynthesis